LDVIQLLGCLIQNLRARSIPAFGASFRGEEKMAHPIILNDQVWCPLCKDYARLLRVEKAVKIADVTRRTIYRYIEKGEVHAVKIAGKTTRICSNCLLGQALQPTYQSREQKFFNHRKKSDKM
jgi:hypothetical protein